MASPHGFAEFYVSCSPPLLPKGVCFVFQSVAAAFTSNEVIELLYEPEIPWFKAITDRRNKGVVLAFIQNLLTTVVKEDSDSVGIDRLNQIRNRGFDAPFESKISADCSRVLPWSSLHNGTATHDGDFDEYRFPCIMRHLKYRAVWRGLEPMDGWTVDRLFGVLKSKWKQADAPTCIEKLEDLVHCRISHNLAANLVYVGSNLHPKAVERALRAFGVFLRISVDAHGRQEHLILTYDSTSSRITHERLAPLEQDKINYVHGREECLTDEYRRLQTALASRARNTKHSFNGRLTSHGDKGFAPFDGYKYPPKQPTAVHGLFQRILEAERGVVPRAQSIEISNHNDPEMPSEEPKHCGLEPVESLDLQHIRWDTSKDIDIGPRIERLRISRSPHKAVEVLSDTTLGDDLTLVESGSFHRSRDYVETWRNAVGRTAPRDAGNPWKPNIDQSPLFFDEPNDKKLENIDAEPRSELMRQFYESDDLICLAEERRSVVLDSSSSQTPHASLLDIDEPRTKSVLPSAVERANCTVTHATVGYNKLHDPDEDLIDLGLNVGDPSVCCDKSCLVMNSTGSQGRSTGGFCQVAEKEHAAAGSAAGSSRQGGQLMRALGPRVVNPPSHAEPGRAKELEPSPTGGFVKTYDKQSCTQSGMTKDSAPFLDSKATGAGGSTHAKLIPGRAGPTECDSLILAKAITKDLASILQLTPGNVSIMLNLGRFYLKAQTLPQVNVGQRGHGKAEATLECVGVNGSTSQYLEFSTALTTSKPETDILAELQSPGEEKWRLCSTQVLYEFTWSSGTDDFVVEVDSQTFAFECRGLTNDLGRLYAHCGQWPWEMQVCVSQSTCLTESETHMGIGRALLASICVGADHDGQVIIETTTDESLRATVDNVLIRHVAQYRHRETDNSMLSLTMVKRLVPAGQQEKRMQWRTTKQPDKGASNMFYEASISSVRAKEILAENRGLKFGEETRWDCDKLEKEGVFEDICGPTFGVITRKGHLGLLNGDELDTKGAEALKPSRAEAAERRKPHSFW